MTRLINIHLPHLLYITQIYICQVLCKCKLFDKYIVENFVEYCRKSQSFLHHLEDIINNYIFCRKQQKVFYKIIDTTKAVIAIVSDSFLQIIAPYYYYYKYIYLYNIIINKEKTVENLKKNIKQFKLKLYKRGNRKRRNRYETQ